MAKKFDPSKDIDKKEMERIARDAIAKQEREKLEKELKELKNDASRGKIAN